MRALAAALLVLAACVAHRGPWRPGEPPLPEDDTITVVALGGTGRGGRLAKTNATELARVLADSRQRGRPAIVLWLGDAVAANPLGKPHCPPAREHWTRDGVADLAAVVREHVDLGGTSFGVPGAAEWRCRGLAPESGTPVRWSAPALVRIAEDGETTIASRCEGGHCSVDPPTQPTRLELVLVDVWPWLSPKDTDGSDIEVARLDALLDALPRAEPVPPRVLIAYLPIEGALARGQGGRGRPLATFHLLPPRLQQTLARGEFVGVIAGGEHGQYTVLDVGWGIRRTEKVWLDKPVWQIVSGAVADANDRPGAAFRRSAAGRGIAYEPAVRTDHGGFTVLALHDRGAEAILTARVRRRWQHARIALPLSTGSHAPLESAPLMSPCMRCQEIPANERP